MGGVRWLLAAALAAFGLAACAAADRLRDRLAAMGVEVTDTRSGTSWRLRP